MKKSIFLICLIGFGFTVKGQTDPENIFSRIYFPFDFGGAAYFSEHLQYGSNVKTGLEYRLKHETGLFFRFNFDNRNADYQLKLPSEISNIENGSIQFNDLVAGPGYRLGNKKWRFTGLIQVGTTAYSIVKVQESGEGFAGKSTNRNLLISKLCLGTEYYLFETVALTFEVGHLYHWQQKEFFIDNAHGLTWSIGLTTTLF